MLLVVAVPLTGILYEECGGGARILKLTPQVSHLKDVDALALSLLERQRPSRPHAAIQHTPNEVVLHIST